MVEESALAESELGNPGLDKLEAGFEHDSLFGRIGFSLGYYPEDFHSCFLDSYFGSFDLDCFSFDYD
uniref:Uncharacterized protein n=1 Tax=Tanacetum cinerariifolium TaxID=118510 RepID=A0A699TDF7_TANCI|nr:hypothetical protein [Tanacetum cinerariifolium]